MAGWTTIADGTDADTVLAAADRPGRYRLRIDLDPIPQGLVESIMSMARAATFWRYTMTRDGSAILVEWEQT